MDWCMLQEVLVFVVAVLQIAQGFTIRAHSGSNQDQHRLVWPSDVDSIRTLKDRIRSGDFPHPDTEVKPIPATLPQRAYTPEESYLYNTLASLPSRDSDLKRSLTPFSTGSDAISAASDDDNGAGGSDDNDDEIDVIATISYPKRGIPALDNLSLSTKIGLLTLPHKRQQGWHVQYGKRTAPKDFTKPSTDDSSLIHYDQMKTKPETSKTPFAAQSADKNPTKPSKYLELSRKLQQLENDLKLRNIAYDIVKNVLYDESKSLLQPRSPVKRQQGWFTQYGKRAGEGGHGSFS